MSTTRQLTSIQLAFSISFLLLPGPVLPGPEREMENQFLKVRILPEQNAFVLESRRTGTAVIRKGAFARRALSAGKSSISDPVWGRGEEILVEQEGGSRAMLRLFPGMPLLHLHEIIHNGGIEPLVSSSEEILRFDVDLGLKPEGLRSYGTGGLHPLEDAPGSFSFSAIVDPRTRRGLVAAWLTHERGSGVFFPGVRDGRAEILARIDFGRYQVDPGRSRPTDTLLLGYFDDARLGLEAYAGAVARLYHIHLPPQPAVYCTWYHAGASNEKKLLANAGFVKEQLKPFGFSVIQIDDRWQERLPEGMTYDGPERDLGDGGPVKLFLESNENYPGGMKSTADRVRALGLVPGLWFMPFAGNWKNPYFAGKQDLFARGPDGKPFTTRWSGTILDMTNPEARDFVRRRVERIAGWGYGYFKLDGLHTGAACHNVYVNTGYSVSGRWQNRQDFGGSVLHDPRKTHIEAYREGLKVVRESAPGVFLLGCNVSQNMRSMGAAFGLIDGMRIGPDNGGAARGRWNQVVVGARHGSNLYFLNGRVWHNDPDPVYVRPSNPLNAARLMVSWVAVTGSMLTASYQFGELPRDRLDLLKRALPGHGLKPRPADLFEEEIPRIWLLTDTRREVRRDVIGLFNWKEKEPVEIRYDMGKLGLDGKTTYTAFDFWSDRFAGPMEGTLEQTLPPGSCRILALRPRAGHPQLISTSRHITQGIIDVLEERWDGETKTLSGVSRLVGGDPYELRIALPPSGGWKATAVAATGAASRMGGGSERGIRVILESPVSRQVPWSVRFE